MRISDFITSNLDRILVDWVTFARNQVLPAEALDDTALLDHGKLILQKIALDMRCPQGEDERQAKSEGHSSHASTSRDLPSYEHARQRERQGFCIEQMVSEYRALRATVLRLWSASSTDSQFEDLEDMVRFNEAVDQAVAESLTAFVAEVEKTRELFLGMLGHDLRGPLGTIKNCAVAVLRTQPSETRPVSIILRSVAQMKSLLDDLMEYTKDRLGADLTINPAPLQLDEFARDTLAEISTINDACVLKLQAQGMMQGEWDSSRLHQALSNLVFNALKYGHPGKPIHVGLDGSQIGEMVLTVRNEGNPISSEVLPRIFEPLVRAETEGGKVNFLAGANLGLGLYVVRQIAVAHGGTVGVTSRNSSTCFELRLPRVSRRQ